ncbi:hypothetical protein CONCODRAFT_167198 [Conidiobolus coronatus NRRL 28638]|uniref:F-box domain-containing protein n=1 Tax=Conidiobolus coronatus (strain ATCC 28846 / CBS 209.66 / NRRL 28638) TaxID=796925 RepID=A0A137NXW7_CONC2|nr:hypothetical protein CONCODRAFT_167198 [Conidiobolus coronatus NRRL 28638]|eukprot:KXN67720.1 hypothetical protein CONCODRAFT_167198 [Conidiobolus coronatus NRRL 28638]
MDNSEIQIDWGSVIIKNYLHQYLSKSDIFTISQISKKVRQDLNSILFNTLTITEDYLYTYQNYFKHETIYTFQNLQYWEKLRLFSKFNFNREIAFKTNQIDGFVDQLNSELKDIALNFRTLNFDSLNKAGYFLIPLTYRFLNLSQLTLISLEVPLFQFSLILSKLQKLEILNLQSISLLKSSEDLEIANILHFPQSLIELTYSLIWIDVTDLPRLSTIEFVTNENLRYTNVDLELTPQYLPNLKKLDYCNMRLSTQLTKFIELNLQLEYLHLPNIFLDIVNREIIDRMSNLKDLSVHYIG